jgi:arsenate reductase-like glutaredoxin family protein
MGLQIFGTRKCPETRKAERFFKERKADYQFIDLAEKGISPGELSAIAAAVPGGYGALMNLSGERAQKRCLSWMEFDAEEEILADPLLLLTPILRLGRKVCIGGDERAWKGFLA